MVLDGFVSLHESLVQSKPKHPPNFQGVTRRVSSVLSTDLSDAKKADTPGRHQAALAIFGLALLLLLLFRIRRSKLMIRNSSRVAIVTSRRAQQEDLPV